VKNESLLFFQSVLAYW